MEGTLNFDVSAVLVVLALLIAFFGLSLVRLPKGGENEPMRVIGMSLIFVCFMAVLGLGLFHSHYFTYARSAFDRATNSHR